MLFSTVNKVFDLSKLHQTLVLEFQNSFSHLSHSNETLVVHNSFSEAQAVQASDIINNHLNSYNSTFDYIFESTKNSQQQNINFGQTLLHDWMRKNIIEGMSVLQSVWVFSRFETFEVNAGFGNARVDLFKMFQSGAIPTVYLCLLQVQPDDMTQPHHWLTQVRIDWVKEQIEAYIGPSMANYIQTLI